jgi:hypothetical protein
MIRSAWVGPYLGSDGGEGAFVDLFHRLHSNAIYKQNIN